MVKPPFEFYYCAGMAAPQEEEQGALLADVADGGARDGRGGGQEEGTELQTVKLEEMPPVVRGSTMSV